MKLSETLVERLQASFAHRTDIHEKRMFGGIAFMLDGHMCVGVTGDALMCRVGPDQHEHALTLPGARPMDFTGRPMKGFVFVDPSGIANDHALDEWIARCEAFVRTLPPKG